MPILTEIAAAHWAGFARWRDFRLALRQGRFPPPDRELPDGPRWDSETLTKWMRKETKVEATIKIDEQDLMERAKRLANSDAGDMFDNRLSDCRNRRAR